MASVNLLKAVESKNLEDLLSCAKKSKANAVSVVMALKDDDLEQFWINLKDVITKLVEELNSEIKPATKKKNPKYTAVFDLVLHLAEVKLKKKCSLEGSLLNFALYINEQIIKIPNSMLSIKDRMAVFAEELFQKQCEPIKYLVHNSVTYLLQRSLILSDRNAASCVKRAAKFCPIFNDIFRIEVEDDEIIEEFIKQLGNAAVSPLYLSMSEGMEIITASLLLPDPSSIQFAIQNHMSTCIEPQGSIYGKIYFDAWYKVSQTENEDLVMNMNEVLIAKLFNKLSEKDIKNPHLVPFFTKFFGYFQKNSEIEGVAKLFRVQYDMNIWRYLKANAEIRARFTPFLFQLFPMPDPDSDSLTRNREIAEQIVLSKDLLYDEDRQVRVLAVEGVCSILYIHYDIFEKETVDMYLEALERYVDSDSTKLRMAVVKGLNILMDNEDFLVRLKDFLPKTVDRFHDVNEGIRIQYCRNLQKISKQIPAIKFYDIIPMKEIMMRLETDENTREFLVQLIANSVFKPNAGMEECLTRAIQLIRNDRESSRVFFTHALLEQILDVTTAYNLIVYSIKMLHSYVKMVQNRKDGVGDSMSSDSMFDDQDTVIGVLDMVTVLWCTIHTHCREEKRTVKNNIVFTLRILVRELLQYYKDTDVWSSLFYFASFFPEEHVPELADMCYNRLFNMETEDEDCIDIFLCIGNLELMPDLLNMLQVCIDKGFPDATKPTASKKRRIGGRKLKKAKVDEMDERPLINPKKAKKKGSRKSNSAQDNEPEHYKLIDPRKIIRIFHKMLEDRLFHTVVVIRTPEDLIPYVSYIPRIQEHFISAIQSDITEEDMSFLKELLVLSLQLAFFLHLSAGSQGRVNAKLTINGVSAWILEELLPSLKNVPQNKYSNMLKNKTLEMCSEMCYIMGDVILSDEMYDENYIDFAIAMLKTNMVNVLMKSVCAIISNYYSKFAPAVMAGMYPAADICRIMGKCLNEVLRCFCIKELVIHIPIKDRAVILESLARCLEKLVQYQDTKDFGVEFVHFILDRCLNQTVEHLDTPDETEALRKGITLLDISTDVYFLLNLIHKPACLTYFIKRFKSSWESFPKDDCKKTLAFFMILRHMKNLAKYKPVHKEKKLFVSIAGRLRLFFEEMNIPLSNICGPEEEDKEKESQKTVKEGKKNRKENQKEAAKNAKKGTAKTAKSDVEVCIERNIGMLMKKMNELQLQPSESMEAS